MDFHYLKKSFLDQSIQKKLLFNFEKRSTAVDCFSCRCDGNKLLLLDTLCRGGLTKTWTLMFSLSAGVLRKLNACWLQRRTSCESTSRKPSRWQVSWNLSRRAFLSALPMWPPVKFFSKFNDFFSGYFDLVNMYVLIIKINIFRGDRNNMSAKTATVVTA